MRTALLGALIGALFIAAAWLAFLVWLTAFGGWLYAFA